MNRIKMIIMLVLMGFGIGAAKAQDWPGGGLGTSDSPYLISTAEHLQQLATNVNAGTTYAGSYFKLTDDIDLSSVCGPSKGNWTPIGVYVSNSDDKSFKGVFDGDGKTISHLYINAPETNHQGLFGYAVSATIKNLNIADSYIEGNEYVGALSAEVKNCTIEVCSTGEDVDIIAAQKVGGLIGYVYSSCETLYIRDCINRASIVANGTRRGSEDIAEAAFFATQDSDEDSFDLGTYGLDETLRLIDSYGVADLVDCAKSGILNARNGSERSEGNGCGGILGEAWYVNQILVENCSNYGEINSNVWDTGGICGNIEDNSDNDRSEIIRNCHNYGDITGMQEIHGLGGVLGGGAWIDDICNCSNSGDVSGGIEMAGICGGGFSVTISNCYNKGNVGGADFREGSAGGIAGSFSGTVNECYNVGTVSGCVFTGGLIGVMLGGQVMNSFNLGTIAGVPSSEVGNGCMGGLVGFGDGTFSNCYNAGQVNGYAAAGGLAGVAAGTISCSYNIAQVFCGPGFFLEPTQAWDCAGGLFGVFMPSESTLTSCYYDKQMCPLEDYYETDADLENVTPHAADGDNLLTTEIVGSAMQPELSAEVWNFGAGLYPQLLVFSGEDASALDKTVSVVSVTPAFLQNEEDVEGVATDFTVGTGNGVAWSHVSGPNALSFSGANVSVIDGGTETVAVSKEGISKYIQMTTDIPCWDGSGTEADPYQLVNASDLVCLAEKVNAGEHYAGVYFKMMNDIDLSSVCGPSKGNWTPIGTSSHPFSGIFDGNEKTISHLYINAPEASDQGLFGSVESATIKNLMVAESQIIGSSNIGAICGEFRNTTFTSCSTLASVEVSGRSEVGGLFGGIYDVVTGNISISNCINRARVIGRGNSERSTRENRNCAGIVGLASASQVLIENCDNYGEIELNIMQTGGIGGAIRGDSESSHIKNCNNYGKVTSRENMLGGIVGYSAINIIECTNFGAVSGTEGMVGGICGGSEKGINACVNEGTVNGAEMSAGIVGFLYGFGTTVTVSNSTNNGKVTGTAYTAGIVSYTNAIISNCTNTGEIVADNRAAGIVVELENGSISNCTNYGNVKGKEEGAAGIAGNVDDAPVTGCRNFGTIECEPDVFTMEEFNNGNFVCAAGIVASVQGSSTIASSFNCGSVKNAHVIGGICGVVSGYSNSVEGHPVIDRCMNFGQIEGNGTFGLAGGVIGNCSHSSHGLLSNGIQNCYNSGMVTSCGASGGIAGYSEFDLANCYNAGNVYVTPCTLVGGVHYKAGIVGILTDDYDPVLAPQVINCYYDKQMCTAEYQYNFAYDTQHIFEAEGVAPTEGQNLLTATMTNSWNPLGDAFVAGTNLYPQLTVFAGETASLVSVTPAFLANEENLEGVATDFTVGTGNGVAWSHVSGPNALSFSGANVSVIDGGTETVAVSKEGISKYIQMTTDIPCWEGEGTEDDPYQLVNASDLVCLAEKVNAGEHYAGVYFKMMNDIDLSSVCGEGVGNWTPIGIYVSHSDNNPFSGVFDGNGKTISNLYINATTDEYGFAALFGFVSEGTIKNLTVAGSVTVTWDYNGDYFYAAGIVAGLDSGNISDCYNMAEIEGGCAGGIFAMADEGSVVENCQNSGHIIGLGALISDNCSGAAGGIGGMLENAEVRNCSNIGNVQGYGCFSVPNSSVLNRYSGAGGIVGCSFEDGLVVSCYNMGSVSEATDVGGICGLSAGGISQCYNLGTVEGHDIISIAGGIVAGGHNLAVTNCYNAGIVKGTGAAGGVVGMGVADISDCYNIGHVSAEEVTLTDEPLTIGFAGGVASVVFEGSTVLNCYYDRQMCPLENDYYSVDIHYNFSAHPAESNNLLTTDMTDGTWNLDESVFTASAGLYPQLTVFASQTASLASVTPAFLSEVPEENVDGVATDFTVGIDNGVVWSQADGADVLAFNGAHVSVTGRGAEIVAVTKGDASKLILMKTNAGSWCWEGEGTEADPFKIADAEGLVCLAGNVNAGIPFEGVHFVVTADIDLSTVCSEDFGNWSSIGKGANKFEGIFDGGNHTISNLYINDEYETCAALFGSVSGATIKNLTVAGEINAKKAAGVCVKAKSSNFDHCTNQVDVVAEDAAGVCYELRGTESSHCLVTNCSNEGDIAVSSGYAGGIIGIAEYVNVSGCSNSGSVEGLYAAGICAYFYDLTEYDEIEESSFITDCHNSGDITASSILYVVHGSYTRERSYAGGIVAYLYGAGTALYGCYNTGSVHATFTYVEEMDIFDDSYRDNAAGGICAYSGTSNVYCSYNTGTVGGAVYNGGIVGYYDEGSPIVNCFNMGIVEGHDAIGVAGGIAGRCVSLLSNCYNAGIVKTSGAAGGIAAMGTRVVNCYNVGYVSANSCEVPGEYSGLAFAGAIGFNVGTITNCYYDKQMCPLDYDYYGHVAAGNNLLTEAMVDDGLQTALGMEYWVYNDAYPLYPQLKAFAESENEQDVTASLVSVTPAFLMNEEDVEGVSTNFTVGTNDGVAWSYESGDNVLRFSGSHVSLLGNGNEMVAVSKDGVNKYIPMTILDVPDNLTWVDVVISEPEGFSTSNIDSPEDLAWFISYVNGFNGSDAHPSADGEITADIDMSAHYWVPIGFYCENVTGGNHDFHVDYKGWFNGNHYNIDGIRIDWNALANSPVLRAIGNHSGKGNRDTYDYLGMFGSIENAIIEDVVLTSGSIVGAIDNHSGAMGGIVGHMKGGKIRACVSNVSLTRLISDPMGGIVGECYGVYEEGGKGDPEGELKPAIIQNCMSTAELNGCGYMGGIVGSGEGIIISNCYGNAKFTVDASAGEKGGASYEAFVGGIVGGAYLPEIQNCYVRLRPDSYYGLDMKDGGGSEHFFGMIAGVTAEETIKHCYVPEGTEYKLVGVCDNEIYQFERATTYEELRTNTKGETFDIALAVRLSEGSYFVAKYISNITHNISGYVSSSEMVGDKEVLDVEDKIEWEMESHKYSGDETDKFNFNDYHSQSLRCDSEGALQTEYNPSYCYDWRIEEVSASKGFGGFMITNWNYEYSLALHKLDEDSYEIIAANFESYKDDPAYNFVFDIFVGREYEGQPNLYGCGTFTEAIANYTYTDPLGGNIITLDNAAEDDFATSGETTLLDALNNWVVYNFGDDTYNPQPDWARFGSALNGDYPMHCYYDPSNIAGCTEVRVITTPDKTNGFPFRFYHHVVEALGYYNAQANGGIIGIYGSDDMKDEIAQSNDENVDVYVNARSYMQCQKVKEGVPYIYYTYFGDNAVKNSNDWYVSLLTDESDELNVHTGFNLDNTDHSGQVGGGTDDWHMVSSPLAGVPVGLSYDDNEQHAYGSDPVCSWNISLDGLFPTDAPLDSYDFYAYSEPDYHWINLKQNSASHYHQDDGNAPIDYTNDTELVPGHGYLIAMDKEVFMQTSGTLNNGDIEVPVTYSGAHNKGLNFLGNPYLSSLDFDEFATNTEAGNASLWDGGTYAQSYMVLDADSKGYLTYAVGQSVNPEGLSRYIWPNQGFYIAADNAGTATFTNAMRVIKIDEASYFRGEEQPNYALVNLKATDSEGNRDMLTVELGRPEVGGARKERDVRNGNGLLYSHYQGGDYSVVFTEEGASQVPVWFESREDDTYTMTWSTYNGTFSYLHLIDNLTGADVDMLANAEYRYASASSDYASRFRLVFAYTGIGEEESEGEGQFVFQSGDELVVTGEGEVDIIDLNGRVIRHSRATGTQTAIAMPAVARGIYMVRLTSANGVKVNKIVVR